MIINAAIKRKNEGNFFMTKRFSCYVKLWTQKSFRSTRNNANILKKS